MNAAKIETIRTVLEKHIQKAINEIADKDAADFYWPELAARRLANQATETMVFLQESREEEAGN